MSSRFIKLAIGASILAISVYVFAAVAVHRFQARNILMDEKARMLMEEEISALAKDAHIVIGEVPLILPFVAMPEQVSMGTYFSLDRRAAREGWRADQTEFRMQASNPAIAPQMDRISVSVETYGWNDSNWKAWKRICGQLTRRWARSVCDNPWAPLQQSLPRGQFYLADDRQLGKFSNVVDADSNWAARLLAMPRPLRSDLATIACDPQIGSEPQFCIAMLPIEDHLVAVWDVWGREQETAIQQAEREGKAITAFVTYALGRTEDFDSLLTVACKTRRPGSRPGNARGIPPDPCS